MSDRLAAWRKNNPEAADEDKNKAFMAASISANTWSKYQGFIKEKYESMNLKLPASIQDLTTFARALCECGLAASTVKNYVGAIKTVGEITFRKFLGPAELSELRRVYDAVDRSGTHREPKRAVVLSDGDLLKITTTRFTRASDFESLQLFITATTALALRPSEWFKLTKDDVTRSPEANNTPFTVVLRLRETKTTRYEYKETECIFGSLTTDCQHGLPRQPLCPAHAIWEACARLDGCKSLTDPVRINDRLKKLAVFLNLDAEALSSYSGRRTGCQTLMRRGVEQQEVLHSGRWKTDAMLRTYGHEELVRKERTHALKILREGAGAGQ
jgi:hypothetical protein